MDYYYALLENYEQLKQRKFKISLREQDEKPGVEGGDAKKAIEDASLGVGKQVALGAGEGVNGVKVYQKDPKIDKEGNQDPVEFVGMDGRHVVTIMSNGVPATEPESAVIMIEKLLKGDEDTDADAGVPGEEGLEGAGDPLAEEFNNLGQQAVGLLDELSETSPIFSEENTQQLRRLLELGTRTQVWTQVDPERQEDSDNQKQAQIDSIIALNDFLILNKEISQNPEGAREGKFVEKINRFYANNNITSNEYGISFDGFMFETNLQTEGEKPITKAVEAVESLQEKDKEEKGLGSSAQTLPRLDLEDDGMLETVRGSSAEFLAEATSAFRAFITGKTASDRKAAAQLLFEKVDQARKSKEGFAPLDDAQLVDVFFVGLGIERGEILTDDGAIRDSFAVKWVGDRLRKAGLPEERVKELLEDASVNANTALVIVLFANRQWEEDYLGDLIPTQTIAVGGGGEIGGEEEKMTDQGAKADMVDTFCEKPDGTSYTLEEVKDHFESLFSPEQKAHYAKACGGEGIGIDSLVREQNYPVNPDDPEPEEGEEDTREMKACIDVDRELKIFKEKNNLLKKGRERRERGEPEQPGDRGTTAKATHKVGQFGMGSVRRACKDDGDLGIKDKDGKEIKKDGNKWTSNSLEYRETVKNRLSACGFADSFQAMCDMQTAIDKLQESYDTIFDRKQVDEDGVSTFSETHAEAALERWWDNASQNKKGQARYEAAKAAIHQSGYPEAVLKEATKTGKTNQEVAEVQLNKVNDKLKEKNMLIEVGKGKQGKNVSQEDKGTLEGDSLDYVLTQYAITGGAEREVVKQKRHLAEGSQSVSLNNAEVQANIAAINSKDGRIRKLGLTQFVVEVKDANDKWQVRAQGDTDKGGITWHNKHDISHTLESASEGWDMGTQNPPNKPTDESLFLTFLTGQQKLLEKLINQTT